MVKAVGDYIVVEPVYAEKSGSIFIPETANLQERISEFHGLVVSVGATYPYSEDVKPGDRVLFRRSEGTGIESGGKKYLALKPQWVLAVMEGK